MKPLLVALVILSSVTACTVGTSARTFRPAFTRGGVASHLMTSAGEFRGELIEVLESGLLILTSSRGPKRDPTREQLLRLVPYTAIRSSSFDQLGRRARVAGGQPPATDVRDRLRLVSRFPYGVTPEGLQQLLASCGQTQVAQVQP